MGERDGGAAFPFVEWKSPDGVAFSTGHFGLSIRDYFAAAAMTGLAANPTNSGTPDQVATISYAIADAMLAARTQGSE